MASSEKTETVTADVSITAPNTAVANGSDSVSDQTLPVGDAKEVQAGATPKEKMKPPPFNTDWRFWMIMLTLAIGILLVSLESTVVITSLPTIVADLGIGSDYIWISNAFFLTR